MKKKVLSLLVAGALTASLLAGCGTTTAENNEGENLTAENETEQTGGETDAASEGDSASGEVYQFVTNNFGAGAYSLDIMVQNEQAACDATGMKLDIADNQFTVDNVITQLQGQIAQQPDGVCFLGITETLFPTAAKICQEANVPFVLYACAPTDEDMEVIQENPCYLGMVIYDPEADGARLGELAAENGNKTAVICAGAAGDYAHDRRVNGFTTAFEAAGGEVLGVAHCADPSEGTTKISDLMTAYPDVDVIFNAGEDYTLISANVLDTLGNTTTEIYGCAVSPDACKLVVDGKVTALIGGEEVTGALAVPLLINYLDGHQILDSDGKAPWFGTKSQYLVDSSNAEALYNFLNENGTGTVSVEEYQQLCYRYNPDVTYESYLEFLENYETHVLEKLQ